jgi:hypothetical protein
MCPAAVFASVEETERIAVLSHDLVGTNEVAAVPASESWGWERSGIDLADRRSRGGAGSVSEKYVPPGQSTAVGCSTFERRLRRRNDSWGEVSEGGRSPPPSSLGFAVAFTKASEVARRDRPLPRTL